MFAKFRLVLILMLAVFVLQSVSAGQTLPPAIQWIPQDAVISLELAQPEFALSQFYLIQAYQAASHKRKEDK